MDFLKLKDADFRDKEIIESLIKDIKLSLYNFVDKKYFSQKIEEMRVPIANASFVCKK